MHPLGLQSGDLLSPVAQSLRESGGSEGAPILDTLVAKLSMLLDKAKQETSALRANPDLSPNGKRNAFLTMQTAKAEELRKSIAGQVAAADRLVSERTVKLPPAIPKAPKDAIELAYQQEIRTHLRSLTKVEREGVLRQAAVQGKMQIIAAMYYDPVDAVSSLIGDVTRGEVLNT
jgi:hypothetical protein